MLPGKSPARFPRPPEQLRTPDREAAATVPETSPAPPRAAEPLSARRAASRGWPRCSERGCVFPASLADSGMCLYHHRLQSEPQLFRSYQPTRLVVEQAQHAVQAADVAALSSAQGLASLEEPPRW
jgi:hypothetical protein